MHCFSDSQSRRLLKRGGGKVKVFRGAALCWSGTGRWSLSFWEGGGTCALLIKGRVYPLWVPGPWSFVLFSGKVLEWVCIVMSPGQTSWLAKEWRSASQPEASSPVNWGSAVESFGTNAVLWCRDKSVQFSWVRSESPLLWVSAALCAVLNEIILLGCHPALSRAQGASGEHSDCTAHRTRTGPLERH